MKRFHSELGSGSESSEDETNENSSCQESSCDENEEHSDEQQQQSEHEQYPFEDFEFVPTHMEKEVVRLALSTIAKTNMYDWDSQNLRFMTICNRGIIKNNEISYFCNFIIELLYGEKYTNCSITYSYRNKQEFSGTLNLVWETATTGSFDLSLDKEVTTTHYFLFTNTVEKCYDVTVEDCAEHAWCYFIDVRHHLNRIKAY